MTDEQLKKQWAKEATDKLVGRKIVAVRYMTKDEVNDCGWFNAAVIIRLDNGMLIYPTADDEQNNAGSLALTDEDMPLIPVI